MKENLWLNLSDGYIGSGRSYFDGTGGKNGAVNHYRKMKADGLMARCIQHEMDHLDGITLLERSSRFKRNRYVKRVRKKASQKGR